MKIDSDKLIAVLHIGYGDDLNTTPEGWFISKRERIIKWLKQKEEE
jgi:hypothetical protein